MAKTRKKTVNKSNSPRDRRQENAQSRVHVHPEAKCEGKVHRTMSCPSWRNDAKAEESRNKR